VPINSEIVDRLEQSFAKEDAFEGPEMLNMARLMASAFIRGGQQGAHARNHPEWGPAEWIHEPFCYQTAVRAVMKALAAAQPDSATPQQRTLFDAFAAKVAQQEAVLAEPSTPATRNGHRKGRKKTKQGRND
jgi:hypothetical protein